MFDFRDRVPSVPNRKKITFEDDGSIKYATIEFADNPIEDGSKLNRLSLMESQGFAGKTTIFNPDGSITTNFDSGNVLVSEFLSDGSIKETLTSFEGKITIKTVTFNIDGSISEVMS